MLLSGTACLGAALLAAACDGGKDDGDARCELDGARYQGGATDETCMVLLDSEDRGNVQVGTVNDSVFVLPTNGQALSSTATVITFRWTSPIDADGDAGFAPPHEPPVTGAVHMIRVKGLDPEMLLFTTLLRADVTGPDLTALRDATGALSLQITSVYLTENRILNPTTDGPFRAATDTGFTAP